MGKQEIICNAIRNRNLIQFSYKGQPRFVEPHLLGRKTSGNIALSAWQVGGYSESGSIPLWRNYLISKMKAITILERSFEGTRPGYNPNDSTMVEIYCRL